MRAVPSTYHQCIKFPHNGVEITVNGDPNPFIYCNNLRPKTKMIIPSNREVVPSSAYIDPESLKPSTSKQGELKGKFQDKSMGEYTLDQTMCLQQVMSSPKEYGRPHPNKQVSIIILKWDPTIFQRWGELEEESLYKMLYKDPEKDTQDHISLPCEKYGKGFKILQKFGYDGKSPLGLRKEGIIGPLQPELTFKKERSKGLGFMTSKVNTQKTGEALQIKVARIQQKNRYSTNSNEWEWDSNKSFNDYELAETFREPGEPTEEEEFYRKFKVGQETTPEDPTQSLLLGSRSKSHRMRTPVLECATSNVNLDLFTIEIDEGSANDNLDDYLDILEYNCIFTLSPTNFEDIKGLPLVHHQLIDWDNEGPAQFDTFQNDEAFINYLGIRDDLPPGDHKAG
ncbi:hypothetical protein SUGI_0306680 [Cryptomeria japonica]|nr:hypothetical protein SUGI_0306680 [Cryptomeria japonica]